MDFRIRFTLDKTTQHSFSEILSSLSVSMSHFIGGKVYSNPLYLLPNDRGCLVIILLCCQGQQHKERALLDNLKSPNNVWIVHTLPLTVVNDDPAPYIMLTLHMCLLLRSVT